MNVRSFAVSVGAWILLAAPAFAIPQNFSSGGNFQLRAGAPFERFAAEKETWAGGALKGDWSEPDKAGVQTLKDDAVVFGLPAAEIKAERSSSGVQRFLVVFREERGKSGKDLFSRLTKNVQAFTGDRGKALPKAKDAKDAQSFHHSDGVLITVRSRAAGEVEVEFRPGP